MLPGRPETLRQLPFTFLDSISKAGQMLTLPSICASCLQRLEASQRRLYRQEGVPARPDLWPQPHRPCVRPLLSFDPFVHLELD
jgi:hypothetical protein